MRDCCTSGNCIICLDLPYGNKKRVSQMGDMRLVKEYADLVAKNWASLNAKVEEWPK
jgi:hypothetical protein